MTSTDAVVTAANPSWLAAALSWPGAPTAGPECYRVGDGELVVRSAVPAFSEVITRLYGACRCQPEVAPAEPRVQLWVAPAPGFSAIAGHFGDPAPLDEIAFLQSVSRERDFRELACGVPGWRMVGHGGQPVAAFAAGRCLLPAASSWVNLLLSFAIARLMRLQERTVFLHAATLGLGGKGCLLVGPKGAGKTTVALGMAARGHGFWGDEIACLRLASRELLPVPRSASVREGPAERAAAAALSRLNLVAERFPDGSPRRRVPPETIGAVATGALQLAAVVFLGPRRAHAELVRIESRREALAALTPLAASLWGRRPGSIALGLAALVATVPCVRLHPSDPDRTCDLLAEWGGRGWV